MVDAVTHVTFFGVDDFYGFAIMAEDLDNLYPLRKTHEYLYLNIRIDFEIESESRM